MKKHYYQINLEGTEILKVYESYSEVLEAFGHSKAANISKLANGKMSAIYCLEESLWTTIPENVAEVMGQEKEDKRALFKVQPNCVRGKIARLHKLARYLSNEKEAMEINKHLIIFMENAKIKV